MARSLKTLLFFLRLSVSPDLKWLLRVTSLPPSCFSKSPHRTECCQKRISKKLFGVFTSQLSIRVLTFLHCQEVKPHINVHKSRSRAIHLSKHCFFTNAGASLRGHVSFYDRLLSILVLPAHFLYIEMKLACATPPSEAVFNDVSLFKCHLQPS